MVVTRSEFDQYLQSADLKDLAVRKQINSTVIDEVVSTRYNRQHWNVAGFAPLNTSQVQYLRPCPHMTFGVNGWQVVVKNQWFCD